MKRKTAWHENNILAYAIFYMRVWHAASAHDLFGFYFSFFSLLSVFIILIIKWTLCDTPCGHAVAFTIKRFLRPESDVENNIIYFKYLLGTSSPPPPPYRPLTVSPCIHWYIIIYPRHHYTMSLCLDSRPALDFRLTARAANKVHACRWGGESEGFLRTFIVHYNIYIYIYT